MPAGAAGGADAAQSRRHPVRRRHASPRARHHAASELGPRFACAADAADAMRRALGELAMEDGMSEMIGWARAGGGTAVRRGGRGARYRVARLAASAARAARRRRRRGAAWRDHRAGARLDGERRPRPLGAAVRRRDGIAGTAMGEPAGQRDRRRRRCHEPARCAVLPRHHRCADGRQRRPRPRPAAVHMRCGACCRRYGTPDVAARLSAPRDPRRVAGAPAARGSGGPARPIAEALACFPDLRAEVRPELQAGRATSAPDRARPVQRSSPVVNAGDVCGRAAPRRAAIARPFCRPSDRRCATPGRARRAVRARRPERAARTAMRRAPDLVRPRPGFVAAVAAERRAGPAVGGTCAARSRRWQ